MLGVEGRGRERGEIARGLREREERRARDRLDLDVLYFVGEKRVAHE